MKAAITRLYHRFDREVIEREIEEELRFHLELLTEQHLRQEIGLAEAKDAALRRFGSLAQIKDECVQISRRNGAVTRVLKSFLILLFVVGREFGTWAVAAVLLGLGTAMVYPTLLAAIGDVAHPAWRAGSVGVYRLWRDLGYACGALLAGIVADALGLHAAIWSIAGLTCVSGFIVAVRMRETKCPSLNSGVLPSSAEWRH